MTRTAQGIAPDGNPHLLSDFRAHDPVAHPQSAASVESMIRGIHHVAVHVHDLDRMVRFYREAFGFEVVGEEFSWRDSALLDRLIDVPGSAARGLMLRAGTCYLELFEFSAPKPRSAGALRPFDKGYTHFCIDVIDIEREYERLRSVGMTFGHPSPIDMGHVKSVYGRDPEGNVIEIQQVAAHADIGLERLRSGL